MLSYAQSCFQRAIELNSKLSASYIEIANLLKAQRRQREIMPLLRTAVLSGCRDSELYALLGHELLRARAFDQAAYYCNEALELNPAHPQAFRDRMLAIGVKCGHVLSALV